jgi:drug/metabolite transporter (DMT)-like permease
VCTIGAFAIYMIGLKKTDAGKSVIFMFIEVIVAFILGWLILDNIPSPWERVGAILIILAIIVVSLKINVGKKPPSVSVDHKSKLESRKDLEDNST